MGTDEAVYNQFKFLLKRFVQQAEANIINNNRSTELGLDGFEKNQYKKIHNHTSITISNIEFQVHLFNSGSYGPKNGNGLTTLPYIDYNIGPSLWGNIRATFENYKIKSLHIFRWNQKTNKDIEEVLQYDLGSLDLYSEGAPNDNLVSFYDTYLSLREGGENKMFFSRVEKYTNSLRNSKNLIFRGAPGTGKTFLARQIAAKLIGCKIDELDKSERFGFVQFHPNYDYSDFVEGLRPVNREGEIGFERRNGIFMDFCGKAIKSNQTGGQDNFDECWDKLVLNINEKGQEYKFPRSKATVTINSMGNIRFDTPVATKEKVALLYRNKDTGLKYETYQKIVLDHLKEDYGLLDYVEPQKSKSDKPYVFIIDEINRGDMSKIFGELFFSIDPGYRGVEGSVTTQFANLYDGTDGKNPGDKFYIPENVYIIGTMNDIDRSVDSFEFAMRRRFRFIEITAEESLMMLDSVIDENILDEVKGKLRNLNNEIDKIEGLNSNYHIGASYFLKLPELDYNFELLWNDYLLPLLVEYLRVSYNSFEQLEELKKTYDRIEEGK